MTKNTIIKIGVYVTLSVILLVWGINFLKGKSTFASQNTYYTIFNNIDGVGDGCPVKVTQRVPYSRIEIEDNGTCLNVIAKISVDKKFRIPECSRIKITNLDIMGSKGIEIERPKTATSYLNDGDTIQSSQEGGLMEQVMELVNPIREHMSSIISQADSAMIALNGLMNDKNKNNITNSLQALNTLSGKLADNAGNLNDMMVNFGKLSRTIGKNSENIDRAISNFASLSDSLESLNMAKTLKEAETALQNVNKMLATINNGSGTAHDIIYNEDLHKNLITATDKLNYILNDFEQHPKKYVNLTVFGGKDKKKGKED
ncbi:MAG: hypothetical protein MJZ61_05205 [Bacteroidales bacterium]|nr:hypothetical protein [Bacteroidales bacterium]